MHVLVGGGASLACVRRSLVDYVIEDVAEFARVLLTTPEMTFNCGWCLQLFIFLKPDFTKRFLGKKALNKFKIPEIIFDLTLRISKTGPVLDSPEKLYSLGVLNGLGQQVLPLKDKLLDNFIFCQVGIGSRFYRGGKITGFDQVTHLYNLQYTGAKEFYNSEEHLDIRTFIRHYKVDVNINVQGIIHKTGALINPDRLFKLSAEESRSLNKLPEVLARQDKAAFGDLEEGVLSYHHSKLREKQEIRENLKQYRNKQPVLDLEQQLAGKLVDAKVMDTLEHKGSMAPQHLTVINTMQTIPGITVEAEYQHRINVINAMTAFCPVEEGRPTPRPMRSGRRAVADCDDDPWSPCGLKIRKNDPRSAFCVWGTLISH
ncbi:hypothetical protein BDW62DRAFT_214876 [Aspergillus aurantiobrunneus]